MDGSERARKVTTTARNSVATQSDAPPAAEAGGMSDGIGNILHSVKTSAVVA